jgi:hypothetical protein
MRACVHGRVQGVARAMVDRSIVRTADINIHLGRPPTPLRLESPCLIRVRPPPSDHKEAAGAGGG